MTIEIQGRENADKQLLEFGQKLAENTYEMQRTFFSHTLDDGRTYWKPSAKADFVRLYDEEVQSIQTRTLTAISNYLTDNPDDLNLEKIIVHVEDPEHVKIHSTPFGGFKQRETHMCATCLIPQHKFNQRVMPDEFVPYLQSCFCESEDLVALLKISGNIVDTTEVHLLDDGVSQTATIRSGAARKSEVVVPSPAILFPFSTFAEVVQPARKFVFRMGSDPLTCSLIEADCGAWRLAAMEGIAKWLQENLPTGVRIIA